MAVVLKTENFSSIKDEATVKASEKACAHLQSWTPDSNSALLSGRAQVSLHSYTAKLKVAASSITLRGRVDHASTPCPTLREA